MMKTDEYLHREFHRYFPTAYSIAVEETIPDETIDVAVYMTAEGPPIKYHMDVGSDDQCFTFEVFNKRMVTTALEIITVPFQAEKTDLRCYSGDAPQASVTLMIDLDATDPTRNDATVDVSHRILTILTDAMPDRSTMNVIEHSAEKLILSFILDGDFEEIQP